MAKKLPKIRTDPRDELIIRKADLVPTLRSQGADWYRYKDLPSLRAFGGKLIIADDVDVPVTFHARWPIEIEKLNYGNTATLKFNRIRAEEIYMPCAELYCQHVTAGEMYGHWLTAQTCNIPKLQILHCLLVQKELLCNGKLTFGPPHQVENHHAISLSGKAVIRELTAIGSQFLFEDLEILREAEINMSRDRTTCIKGNRLHGDGVIRLFARDADIKTIDFSGKLYFGDTPLTAESVKAYQGILGGMLHVLGDCWTAGEVFVTQDIRANNLTAAGVIEAGWNIICEGDITCNSEIRAGTRIRTGEITGQPPRIECNRIVRGTIYIPQVIERAQQEVTTSNRVLRIPIAQEKPPVE